ncbi:glutathione S-transferase F12-like [Dendrobium catenatum]|uniref:glutathione S-transferase F12-like n=1 Tax=Dendrobium catenatum TaxID=906689 RepID=UPI0010A094AF|nr:glutathione S-transferase F12-like [Dendrobium catenatum]
MLNLNPTVSESRAICRHIVDKFKNQGNKDLMGEGVLERALIEQWLETESHKFDPPSSELVFFLAVAPSLPEPELPPTSAIEESKKKLEKVLEVYDHRLADNQFLTGSKFTLADLFHLPNTEQLMRIDETRNLFERHGNVSRWWKDVSKRESWEKVIQIAKQPPPMA